VQCRFSFYCSIHLLRYRVKEQFWRSSVIDLVATGGWVLIQTANSSRRHVNSLLLNLNARVTKAAESESSAYKITFTFWRNCLKFFVIHAWCSVPNEWAQTLYRPSSRPWKVKVRALDTALWYHGTALVVHERVYPRMEWTIPDFAVLPKLVLIYRPWRDGRLSWLRNHNAE